MTAIRDSALRREAIIEAAWACFLQHGYAKTSLGDVARQAGVSRPSIYVQFASKKDLFRSVVESRMDADFAAAKRVLQSGLPPRQMLLRVISVWLLEPLARVMGSARGEELFEQALGIETELCTSYQSRSRELFAAVLGDCEAAIVLQLALKGLLADRPGVETLRARVELLIGRFVS
jgi:AcrR family transcriptional regulator